MGFLTASDGDGAVVRIFHSFPFSGLVSQRLHIEFDENIVPHNDSPAVQRRVPTHAEIVPVDPGCRVEAGARDWSFVDPVLPVGRLPFA